METALGLIFRKFTDNWFSFWS